ncbi:TRPT1 [Symbiodinium pilosum]|uniref:TRPT1 protein n=1 Tax=Symbiodinium pilosum TaxID=2952 RepID=A0A812VVP5_SYMPI|nr:TRPT1 [Symbiodinium pilosum]
MLFADSDEEQVLSLGFQDSCNILVYINMGKALFAGIPFSRAPDGMVVSPGINEKRRRKTEKIGTIPADFILRVVNRYGADREEVFPQSRGAVWRSTSSPQAELNLKATWSRGQTVKCASGSMGIPFFCMSKKTPPAMRVVLCFEAEVWLRAF